MSARMGGGSVTAGTQFLRDDEEGRLLTDYGACHADQLAAAEK